MKKGKFESPPRRRTRGGHTRAITLLLALVLLMGCAIGGTLAWITAEPQTVENVFTTTGIDITLTEEKGTLNDDVREFKMIPGWTIDKDPLVTVKANSEDCYVFIQVNESANLDQFISYTIDSKYWKKLEGVEGVDNVWYYSVTADGKTTNYAANSTTDREIPVLTDNKVQVLSTVTKTMMDGLKAENATQPTLTFTAYAVQYWQDNDTPFEPADAWKAIGN